MQQIMRYVNVIALAVAIAALLLGCGGGGQPESGADDDVMIDEALLNEETAAPPVRPDDAPNVPSNAVAAVNGEAISAAELAAHLHAELRQLPQDAPPDELTVRRLRETALHRLIRTRLIGQEARKQQVSVTDAEFQAFVKQVQADYNDDDIQAILQEQGQTYADWERAQRETLLLNKLIDLNMASMITVSPPEIERYYEQHKEKKYDYPAQVRASQMLIYEEAAAKRALQEIHGGKPFEEVARTYSESPDASNGGDLGFFARGVMPPEFEEVIFALKEGEVSDVVRTPYGYQIFKLTGQREASRISFDEAKPQIEQLLKTKKRMAATDLWIAELETNAKIVLNHARIAEVK